LNERFTSLWARRSAEVELEPVDAVLEGAAVWGRREELDRLLEESLELPAHGLLA
jgi:hypothetical protein